MPICKNSKNIFEGKFCNQCGEKVYTDKDKSIVHFFGEAFHFITHFEGTLFTTLKTMFKTPGKLSVDYCNGVRKKYFKPLSFFLLLVIIYLLFPVIEGLNMQLQYYPSLPLFGKYASKVINEILAEKSISFNELSLLFHSTAEKTSKFLILIILPFSALVCFLLGFKRRSYFFDHLIFTTEINSFYLLWGFLILPLVLSIVILFSKIFNTNVGFGELSIGLSMYLPTAIYTSIASKRFYQIKGFIQILFVTIYLIAHVLIVYTLYKLLLFVVTINQIH